MLAGSASADPRIIGGQPAEDLDPVTALYEGERMLCGGALIAPDTVLTAAHCASKLPETEADVSAVPVPRAGMHIRVGSLNRTEGEMRHVTAVGMPRNWAWSNIIGRDDLAVLHLDMPVLGITPAEVGSPDPAQEVRIVGWGLTQTPVPPLNTLLPPSFAEQLPALPDFPKPEPPTMLNEVDLWQVDPSQCPPVDPSLGPDELCLAPERVLTDTCDGDSGTPGLQGTRVVAIVSRGTNAALPCGFSHTVATDPGRYIEWIEDTITQQRAAA